MTCDEKHHLSLNINKLPGDNDDVVMSPFGFFGLGLGSRLPSKLRMLPKSAKARQKLYCVHACKHWRPHLPILAWSFRFLSLVLNVAFYMRRMHSKQWIMRHFSWLSIVLNAFGTCKIQLNFRTGLSYNYYANFDWLFQIRIVNI